jgi:hypothetical protein
LTALLQKKRTDSLASIEAKISSELEKNQDLEDKIMAHLGSIRMFTSDIDEIEGEDDFAILTNSKERNTLWNKAKPKPLDVLPLKLFPELRRDAETKQMLKDIT